jgi:hypothetical protein
MIQAGSFVNDDKVEHEVAPLDYFPRTIDLNHKCNVSLRGIIFHVRASFTHYLLQTSRYYAAGCAASATPRIRNVSLPSLQIASPQSPVLPNFVVPTTKS